MRAWLTDIPLRAAPRHKARVAARSHQRAPARWRSAWWGALLLTLVACDAGEPPVATTLMSGGSRSVSGAANATLLAPPTVTLTDQRSRGLSDVLVTWTVGVGSGSVVNDTVRTNSSGVASSGGWRLGTRAGTQTLTATVAGLEPVVFLATVGPGPAAVLQRTVPDLQPTVVNRLVPIPPALRVLDAFDNAVPGATVIFAVTAGGGAIIGSPVQVSNANGEVSLEGWRIGTRTDRSQVVTATVSPQVQPLLFRATPLADTAVLIEAASTLDQNGVPFLSVSIRPAVRARDIYGNPAGGVTVTFTPRANSGTVTGSTRITSMADGIARVGNWTLGDAPVQTLVARAPQFPDDSIVFVARAVESLFSLETIFVNGEPSARNLQAVETAIARWHKVIAGQLEPAQVFANADECGPGVPALDAVIANVRIYINFDSIDGVGKVLGRAGPCIIRTASGLPVVGYVELDTADLINLNTNGTIDDVMTHEFGHVLGLQSFNWNRRGLVAGLGEADPFYQGAIGREQFASVGGGSYTGTPVPLENTGGSGTRDSHWRISVLRRELMVGFAQAGGMPLSRLSVGSLADLGYHVRLENAEPFVVPPFGTAAFGALTMPGTVAVTYGDDTWPTAIWTADRAGRRTLVRSGDWRVTRRGQERNGERGSGR